jgi:hypothetical protein
VAVDWLLQGCEEALSATALSKRSADARFSSRLAEREADELASLV